MQVRLKGCGFQSPDPEEPLEEAMATHSSILIWRILWTEDPGRLESIGLQRVRHDWSDLAHSTELLSSETHEFDPAQFLIYLSYIPCYIRYLVYIRYT